MPTTITAIPAPEPTAGPTPVPGVLAARTPPVGDAVTTGSLALGVGDPEPDPEEVAVGNTEPVGLGVGDTVPVGFGVGETMLVGVGVGVGDTVLVGVGDPPSVGVGDGPGVPVGGDVQPTTRMNPVAKRPLAESPVASLSSW